MVGSGVALGFLGGVFWVVMEPTEDISSSASSSFEERPVASGSGSKSVHDKDGFSGDTELVATTSRSLCS